MNSEMSDPKNEVSEDEIDDFDDDALVETVVLPETEATDNVGDASVEINVEELIADIEGGGDKASARKMEVRRKLEEIAESQSMEDTYAIEFDE